MLNIKKIKLVTPVTQKGDRDIKEQNVCIKLKSGFYQFKIDYYFKMFYIIPTMNKNYLQKIHTKNNEQELSKFIQIINKTQMKTVTEGESSHKTYRKQQNDTSKSLPFSNYFNCKWIKLPNQKTDWLDKLKGKIQLYAVYK